MDPAGRALLDEVNEAARALQTAVDEATPCSPSLRLYVRQQIDALRHAAGQATFSDVAAASSAPTPTLPPVGAFAYQQAVRQERMNLDANFRTEPALMPGQGLPNADKFVLVLTSGGPEHHPAIELAPYVPLAESGSLAGRSTLAAVARENLQRYWDGRREVF
eukprot:4465552-Alexandrium_andersonii.AAC.1